MAFYFSVDLGQAADYTALSGLETISKTVGHLRYLERLPLGLPYPAQVQHIKAVISSPLVQNPTLIVDYTGVGRAVVDLMRTEGLNPICITITGGNDVKKDGVEWHIPKREIIFALILAFQRKRIKIANTLTEAPTLVKELSNFKMKVNLKTGHDSYEAWRDGQHDDLVLSVGMAVYASNLGYRDIPCIITQKNRRQTQGITTLGG